MSPTSRSLGPTSTFLTLVPITALPTPQFPSPNRNRLPLVSLRTPTLQLEHRSEAKQAEARLPIMAEILESATAQNLDLRLQTLGPFFRITARRVGDGEELGKAEGLIRVWVSGKILHLDSIKLRRESLGMEKSIFGIGLFIGAVAIRYGYDCGCREAELLAINDSDLYHFKLVRFYKRIGFEVAEEVSGGKVGDVGHMLVWGGIGTRCMRKHGAANLIPLDLEIERTCRKNRKNTRQVTMDPEIIDRVENRTLLDYVMPSVVGVQSAIRKPAITGNNFEIKPGTIHMIQQSQFSGLASEDPNDHIANFVEICDTFKFHNISDDAVKLRLFPFSLRDRAKSWLNSLPADSITTWAELCQKFLSKLFPFEKTAKYRNDIVNFNQFDGKTLYEAWARFKELLRKYPQHGLPRWMQVRMDPRNKEIDLDSLMNGTIPQLTDEDMKKQRGDYAPMEK